MEFYLTMKIVYLLCCLLICFGKSAFASDCEKVTEIKIWTKGAGNYELDNIARKRPTTRKLSKMDYLKKTVASDFHPRKNVVAVASLNCFFLYGM